MLEFSFSHSAATYISCIFFPKNKKTENFSIYLKLAGAYKFLKWELCKNNKENSMSLLHISKILELHKVSELAYNGSRWGLLIYLLMNLYQSCIYCIVCSAVPCEKYYNFILMMLMIQLCNKKFYEFNADFSLFLNKQKLSLYS